MNHRNHKSKTYQRQKKRRTLFDTLLDLEDEEFEMSDWNKLQFRGTSLILVPNQPEGLKLKGTDITFQPDADPQTVIKACQQYLVQQETAPGR